MIGLLKPYRGLIALLVTFGFLSNGVSLVFPELIGRAMDTFTQQQTLPTNLVRDFGVAILIVAILGSIQSLIQT